MISLTKVKIFMRLYREDTRISSLFTRLSINWASWAWLHVQDLDEIDEQLTLAMQIKCNLVNFLREDMIMMTRFFIVKQLMKEI